VSDPHDDQREAAERETKKAVELQAKLSGGWTEQASYKAGAPAWADDIIRRFNEARPTAKACPHLQQAPTQPSLWLVMVPDLLACQRPGCAQQLVSTLEERLGHSLADEPSHCSACGRLAEVRGVSIGVQTTMIRAMICATCFGEAEPAQDA
jgi:hypothetical protein